VVDVLLLSDIAGVKDIGPVVSGDPIMVNPGDDVSYSGQVLFAVAATSHRLARKAASRAKVSYEPLPADISIEQGQARGSYLSPAHIQQRGDADLAISKARHKLTGELHIGGQDHVYLEGQVSLCVPVEDGGMLVYSSTQSPTDVQKQVAAVLGIQMNRVTVDVRRMGGGFGGKETQAAQWACIAALLAWKTGQAVKIRLDRSDDMIATGKRHPFLSRYRVGIDEEGQIQGLDTELISGCGASADLSDAVIHRAMFHADNAYFLPDVRVKGIQVRTNIVSSTAFRGFGAPQAMLSTESMIDDIARTVGKDPLEIRKLNFYTEKEGRDTTHYGQAIEQNLIHRLVERLEKTSDYQQRRCKIREFNASNPILKKGLALTPVKFGIAFAQQHLNQAGALLHIHKDGSIEINHGGTEMGQGLFTKVAQVIATEFSIDIERIDCCSTRTDKVPNTSPTAASTGSDLNGMAARKAAKKIKNRMIRFATRHFGVTEPEVVFAGNQVIVGDRALEFSEFVQLAYMNRVSLSATGFYRTPKVHYDRNSGKGRPFHYYVNGAAASEVLIDTLTGEYKVLRADICEDVGHSLNPALDKGQIEGGFIQGMGWLTTEELLWSEEGRLETRDLSHYKIPGAGDLPEVFNIELLSDNANTENTIYHSKAVGEPPLMLAISVWCAIRDAISSIAEYRFSPELNAPATPERVLNACSEIRARTTS
jgi:xanthine dehydrogenase large subunit